MQRVLQFTADVIRWVGSLALLWANVLALVVPALLIAQWPDADLARRMGLTLQLIGVATVVAGIRDTRRRFNRKSWVAETWGKLVAFPNPWRRPVQAHMSARLSAVSAHGFATATATAALNETMQKQIDRLSGDLNALRTNIEQRHREAQTRYAALDQRITDETNETTRVVQDVRRLLTDAQTGGLNLSVFGTICIMIGTVLGTAPQEVVCLARQLISQ